MADGSLVIPADLDNENKVLGIMVAKLSGDVLSGLLTAGILAAIIGVAAINTPLRLKE